MATKPKRSSEPLKTQDINPIESIYVDPRREYLAGGVLSKSTLRSGYGRGNTLSGTPDDLMREFGYQIYDQMSKDPKVHKCIKILKVDSLGDGVDLLPSVSDSDPNYDTAKKIADFCTYAIKGLRKPLKDTLNQMLDALVYGHKIAEIVYKTEYVEEFGGTFLTLDSIKPKPIGLARFVVDNSLNILGIVGTNKIGQDGVSNNIEIEQVSSSNIVTRGENTFIKLEDGSENLFLNIDKFMVLTIDAEDDDPRGRSMLRAAFNFWNLKQQIIPELLRFILTCSIPLLIGFTPEDQEGQSAPLVRDSAGNIVRDSAGRPIAVNREEAMREALMQARNATTLAVRGGSKVQEVGGTGSGLPFYKSLEMCDSQIEASILLQTLATSEGRYSSRAQSQTHMDTLENLVWDIKKVLADTVTYQLLKPLIKYNFGKEYIKYLPVVSLGDTERRNFSLDGATVATLYSVGYMSEDQKRYTDQMLGLPVRDASYNPLKNITADEALRYSDAVLQQSKLESDIKKQREASNLERVNQIVGLQTLLQTTNVDSAGNSTPSIDASIIAAINEFTVSVLADIAKDKLDDDQTRILGTLVGIGARAQQVLTPQKLALGKLDSLDADSVVDTTLKPAGPSSGTGDSVPQPYISTKSSKKPATF